MQRTDTIASMRQLLVGFGVALLGGLALLADIALDNARAEARLRHQAVAARVFDELERELTEVLRQEEARPFLHWRHLVIAESQVSGRGRAVLRSPLAPLPADAWKVGYFQINPDGSLVTPHELLPDEASKFGVEKGEPGWITAELGRLTSTLPRSIEGPAHVAPAHAVAPPTASQASEWQFALNNAEQPRQQRATQQVQKPVFQLHNFIATASAADEQPLDVTLSPMEVHHGPDDTVTLWRAVRIEQERWIQGLVIRQVPLQLWLAERALGDDPPNAYLSLDWSGAGDLARPYRFTHAFGAPFDTWAVTASLAPLADVWLTPTRTVAVLALLVVFLVLAGLAATTHTLSATLAYARQRENFVAAVTHEMKSPLTAIHLYAEMLESGMVADPDKQRHYTGTIRAEAARLGRLVDDVLTFSHLQRGTRGGGAMCSLGEVVDRARTMLAPRLEGRPLSVDIADTAAAAEVDGDAVEQVITNLIENALKFSGGPVRLRVWRDAAPATRAGDVWLTVRDHGPGVTPGFQRRMFEPFVRAEDELVRETTGTGLGLALVAGLVDEAGGQVQAVNHPRGGLEVTVRWPVEET